MNPHNDNPPQNVLQLRTTRELARVLVEQWRERKNAVGAAEGPGMATEDDGEMKRLMVEG